MVSDLSEALQTFLRDSISSYEELEALLLLVTSRHRSWTDDELAETLKVQVDRIEPGLDALASIEGLLAVDNHEGQRRFQYAPKNEQLRQVVEELATAYVEQRLRIMQLMSTNALDRVRRVAIHGLANAFRVHRPKK